MKQMYSVAARPAAVIPGLLPRVVDPAAHKRSSASTSSLVQQRAAVSSLEPEDAMLTGLTRSLDRRRLALNLNLSPMLPVTAMTFDQDSRRIA